MIVTRLTAAMLYVTSWCISFVVMAAPPIGSKPLERPGDQSLPAPAFDEPVKVAPIQAATPKILQDNSGTLSIVPIVTVTKFVFNGNNAITNDVLQKVAKPYIGRKISSAELQQLRQELTLIYVNRGYINSGVILPDQKIASGVIHFNIIEGRLIEIQVDGNSGLADSYISDRLLLDVEEILDINNLQQKIQLLQQNPRIKRINAELKPGLNRGEAILRARVEEARAYDIFATLNNHQSPSVGSERGQIEGLHRNLLGYGDILYARLGLTEGLNDYSVSYDFPLNGRDTTFKFRYDNSDSEVIEEPFDIIDIESKSSTVSFGIEHPVYRTTSEEFIVGVSIDRRRSESFLLGIPFSFAAGTVNGKSEVSVLRLNLNWTQRTAKQVLAARSTFSVGVDLGDVSLDSNNPDGRFISWLGQFQWARRFGENNNQFIFRTDVQLADDELLPLEKFAVGGANSVRGYRENQFVRDNGIVSSLEFRLPIGHDEGGVSRLQFAPFIDVGKTWEKGQRNQRVNLSSVGVGLLWQPTQQLYSELYVAKSLRNIDNVGHNLQDSGIHFSMIYSFF